MQPVFHNNIKRFMYFPQQRHLQRFLFIIRSHNHVYLIIILTQEEEHSQLFWQQSAEVLVRSIHFVHFIHLYLNLSPQIGHLFHFETLSHFNLLSFVFIRCHSLYHSMLLVSICCHSLPFIVTRCHSLSLVVTRCHSLYHSPVSLCHSSVTNIMLNLR